MYKKRALVLGGYLSLLALAACGPKVIDDADLVSVDYLYTFSDGSVVEQGSKDIVIGDAGDFSRIESIIRGAKQDEKFEGKINGNQLYGSEYNEDLVQKYPNIILTEVMGISDPVVGSEVHVDSIGEGDGIVKSIEKDEDGYDVYVVEFNDPKTYSELSYSIKVTNIEKR